MASGTQDLLKSSESILNWISQPHQKVPTSYGERGIIPRGSESTCLKKTIRSAWRIDGPQAPKDEVVGCSDFSQTQSTLVQEDHVWIALTPKRAMEGDWDKFPGTARWPRVLHDSWVMVCSPLSSSRAAYKIAWSLHPINTAFNCSEIVESDAPDMLLITQVWTDSGRIGGGNLTDLARSKCWCSKS